MFAFLFRSGTHKMAAFPCVVVFFNVAAVLYFNGSEVDARLFLLN